MQRIRERLLEERVLLVPAHVFYTHRFERPRDLSEKDLPAFVELSLEGVSPFPLEQLVWGFLASPGSPNILAYATPRSRLQALGLADLAPYVQVFPSFIPALALPPGAPTRIVCENGTLSLLVFAETDPIPLRVTSRPVTAEVVSDEAIAEGAAALWASAGLPPPLAPVATGAGQRIADDYRLWFAHRSLPPDADTEPTWHRLPLEGPSLQSADLRGPATAAKLDRDRRRARYVWWAFAGAGALTALLLLAQLSAWGLQILSNSRQRQVEGLAAAVEHVYQMQDQADRLAANTRDSLQPFQMLELINGSRPDEVYFEKVESKTFNVLEISGKSRAIPPVSSYAEQLNALPFVETAVLRRLDSEAQSANFELVVTFRADYAGTPSAPLPPEGVATTDQEGAP